VEGGEAFVRAGEVAEGEGGAAAGLAEVGEVVLAVELFLPVSHGIYSGLMTTSSVSDSMASGLLGNWVV
jgi:hypothetical protein